VPISTLFERGWNAYYEEEQDDGAALWLFIHLPKTAGSSLRAELVSILRPNANITVDHLGPVQTFAERLDQSVSNFIEGARETRYRFASGHLHHAHLERIAACRPDARRITMLRNPTNRVISAWRYMRTPAHPPYEKFKVEFPTLESFVESEQSRNEMHLRLATDPSEPVESVVQRLSTSFSFVGLTEAYPISRRVLRRLLGARAGQIRHQRKTEDTADNAVDPSPAMLRRITELNDKDWEIYRHFRSGLLARRDELRAMFAKPDTGSSPAMLKRLFSNRQTQ
jgi:hypothetical protein